MIGRGGDDGIDVLAVQEPAVIFVAVHLLFAGVGLDAFGKQVGHGQQADLRGENRCAQQAGALASHADDADGDARVSARPSVGGQHTCGNQLRGGQSGGGQQRALPQETSA